MIICGQEVVCWSLDGVRARGGQCHDHNPRLVKHDAPSSCDAASLKYPRIVLSRTLQISSEIDRRVFSVVVI